MTKSEADRKRDKLMLALHWIVDITLVAGVVVLGVFFYWGIK